jgi:hypothetical protein
MKQRIFDCGSIAYLTLQASRKELALLSNAQELLGPPAGAVVGHDEGNLARSRRHESAMANQKWTRHLRGQLST